MKDYVPATVSGPMLRQKFHACELDYIRGVCHARCCDSKDGARVFAHASERPRLVQLGCTINGGFIQPQADSGLCHFKAADHLCSIHEVKPLGCRASPFMLNKRGTLVIRNRYRLLVCYRAADAQPAYQSHYPSLVAIFGDTEASRIAAAAAVGEDRIAASMPREIYVMLADREEALHAESPPTLTQMVVLG